MNNSEEFLKGKIAAYEEMREQIVKLDELTFSGIKEARGEIDNLRKLFKQKKNLDKKIKEFVKDGSRLGAVKYAKELMGWGLKEAKDYVDNLCPYKSQI